MSALEVLMLTSDLLCAHLVHLLLSKEQEHATTAPKVTTVPQNQASLPSVYQVSTLI